MMNNYIYLLNCECLNCGFVMTSREHCLDIKCPKCGGEMRRLERPGPGATRETFAGQPNFVSWLPAILIVGMIAMLFIEGKK